MLIVLSGAMGSGKSKRLIEYIEASSNYLVFKPSIDDRTKDFVHSRNGQKKEAININNLSDIFKYLNDSIDNIFIDEVQFLNDTNSIKDLLFLSHKYDFNIYVSGLELDSDLNVFTTTALFMAYADDIDKQKGICQCCNTADSYASYCSVKKDGQILTGDSVYQGLCLPCYISKSNL